MRKLAPFAITAALLALAGAPIAHAEPDAPRIEWEVKNRFRLFRSEADFRRHVAARSDSVLASEQRLARESDGRGWARDTVERLCADRGGRLLEFCERDGERESYLSPRDHRIGVTLEGILPVFDSCLWSFDDGEGPARTIKTDCIEEVKLRVRYGKPTLAAVDIVLLDGTTQRVETEIQVRDVLIAGMGDSIAAGDGNPDRAVRLSDEGFCFRRLSGSEYFRPGRAGFSGNRSCGAAAGDDPGTAEWMRQSARWMSGPCHRSLYGYQMRTALALAVEYPHIAVTFLPLACSGATVSQGFLDHQRARECPSPGTGAACPGFARAQMAELNDLMALARRQRPDRELDLVLLTIGANDIHFSGLVANIIVEATTERSLLRRGGAITSVEEAQQVLERELPGNFARLRAALKPHLGGDLARVVFVSYGNPALSGPDTPCPGGRDGFDVHPAFGADGERLRQTADFVAKKFLPGIRSLALCEPGKPCRDPTSERMTFVDAHQPAFAEHGVCARSSQDPPFDRECFSPKGESFSSSLSKGATDPLLCSYVASEFRPYAPRTRWVRTANDSYLTAMTYPEGLPALLQPRDLHDAIWGIFAAVYGGAVHPTAEGHAAMADAALPAVRDVLALPPTITVPVFAEPLDPAPSQPSQDAPLPNPLAPAPDAPAPPP
jgi:lysophospholipase L1-like esterase